MQFFSYFRRVCIVCGQLAPITSSVVYPKGRHRRKEFDSALGIPSYVSDALPAGCYICNAHFNSNDLEVSTNGPAQVSDITIPTIVSFKFEILISILLLGS